MIVQEVMESANSVLNASADNSEEVYRRVTPPNRPGVMVSHACDMLKAFLAKMRGIFRLPERKESQVALIEMTDDGLEEEVTSNKSWQPETTDTGSIQTSHGAGSVHSKASGTGSVLSKALSSRSVLSKASGLSRGSEGSFVIETEAVQGIIIKEFCGIEEPLLDNMKDTEIEVLKSDTSEWIKSISGDILVSRIYNKSKENSQLGEPKAVTERLFEKVWAKVEGEDFKITPETFKNIDKVVYQSLCKQWKGAAVVLVTVTGGEQSADDVMASIFKYCLTNQPKKRGAVSRFFHRVGRAILKPFRRSPASTWTI
ncbi:hypothetical protein JOQ06_018077 [Pogonophryne albipinna]|uniref:Uncharacterized protein n=1 Tax=Pogonophryne albipinna TaxID=1090488 RepID=A0AAD6AJ59_9TELE|nr:hypothetical protein JOQ06_018077 [Pogonophryne albipinna]